MPMLDLLPPGVYPAAVTPFDEKGRIDVVSSTKLMAWFEAAGCEGVVLAGTNGEGPSLSAVEKRDRVRDVKSPLRRILGIATPSLDEAIWLTKRAAEFEAVAALVMPPGYFRSAGETGITDWFLRLLDASPIPILAYHYPKMTGIPLSEAIVRRIADHPRLIGLKDSSGEPANLPLYKELLPKHVLFVGDETLLWDALGAGWSGTISGAANLVPEWLVRIVREFFANERESAKTKFELLLPVLQTIRRGPQPALNKGVLCHWNVIESGRMRSPLEPADSETVSATTEVIRERIGLPATLRRLDTGTPIPHP